MPKITLTKTDKDIKPYDKPDPLRSSPKDRQPTKQGKLDYPVVAKPSTSNNEFAKKGKKNEYDKLLLVTLLIKTSKDVKWDELALRIHKTATQCKDVWRKVIQPALCRNKPWANHGTGWTKEMKVMTLLSVLNSCNANWDEMTSHFPGKSKSQLKDIWRKVILPRLQKGDTIE